MEPTSTVRHDSIRSLSNTVFLIYTLISHTLLLKQQCLEGLGLISMDHLSHSTCWLLIYSVRYLPRFHHRSKVPLFHWLVWITGKNMQCLLLGCLPAEHNFWANGNDHPCFYSEGWAQEWNDGHDNPSDNKEGERYMAFTCAVVLSCIVLWMVIQSVRKLWSFTFPFICVFSPAVSWWK